MKKTDTNKRVTANSAKAKAGSNDRKSLRLIELTPEELKLLRKGDEIAREMRIAEQND